VDLNPNFTSLDDAALVAYATEVRAAFDALVATENPTIEQITEAESLADHLEEIIAHQETQVAAEADRIARAAALRDRFATAEVPEDEVEVVDEEEEVEEVEPTVEVEEPEAVAAPAARATVTTLASRTPRPSRPAPKPPVVITAAADVPEFATGSRMESLGAVATATINRMRGFGTPSGDGLSENLQHYGVASFRTDFPEALTIDRHSDDMEVLNHAANEHRLPGGSLVASGGWCAPSETIYDLCPGASTDGMLSLPEVNVARGGIKYTRGPDFSALYTAGFCQTEAQAISGTTKPCYEVPCPTFVEVRLDACGICIKVPILTNAAYPELVATTISEAMVAHQHAMNAKVLASLATHIGAAVSATGLGAASTDTLEALLLQSANLRQKYRLPLNQSLEVVMPFWAEDVLLADVARRNGGGYGVPTSGDISAIFSAANMSVQFVYDWEPLPDDADAWPATIPTLIYPAGSFVVGKSDVINLTAVYDAASRAVNTYTALFFEQGILVAPLCRDGIAVDIPVCTAGATGDPSLACATLP
jgi:hypothetical protein